MKRLRVFISIALLTAMYACDKIDNNQAQTKANPTPTPCCEVNCKNGSCKAYGAPCHCTCTLLGKPDCQGSEKAVNDMPDSLFDGRVFVVLDKEILKTVQHQRDILYSFNKEYAKKLADGMFGYEKLIKKHGYNLKTKEALLDYYALVSLENLYENDFTDEELVALLQ